MKHFGDITKINGHDVPIVDVVTGGSPCQDLSVAGRRAGLAGERSGLFMEQIRIIKEMRKKYVETNGFMGVFRIGKTEIKPRYMVWENVPGAFSSNSGEDFRAVLEETARVAEEGVSIPGLEKGKKWSNAGAICGDGWSIAWRVHDAQFWGVPQRRKRISLLADFNGYSAPDILFECFRETSTDGVYEVVTGVGDQPGQEIQSFTESMSGYTDKSEQTWEEVAGSIGEGSSATSYTLKIRGGVEIDSLGKRAGKGALIQKELSATLGVSQDQTLFCFDRSDQYSSSDVSSTQSHRQYKSATDLVVGNSNCVYGLDCYNQTIAKDITQPIRAKNADTDHIPCVTYGQSSFAQYSDGFGTLKANGGDIGGGSETLIVERQSGINGDIAGCLDSSYYKGCGQRAGVEREVIISNDKQMVVRRLTPKECERLQNFPDDWTNIGEWIDSKGKLHKDSDAPRYKALGNSIALPFWDWLAERICNQYDRPVEMASLFDGIGGFPLVFEKHGGKAVWASEIEEFPIAVTKKRFPEGGEQNERLFLCNIK